jgi:hypothetical protein
MFSDAIFLGMQIMKVTSVPMAVTPTRHDPSPGTNFSGRTCWRDLRPAPIEISSIAAKATKWPLQQARLAERAVPVSTIHRAGGNEVTGILPHAVESAKAVRSKAHIIKFKAELLTAEHFNDVVATVKNHTGVLSRDIMLLTLNRALFDGLGDPKGHLSLTAPFQLADIMEVEEPQREVLWRYLAARSVNEGRFLEIYHNFTGNAQARIEFLFSAIEFALENEMLDQAMQIMDALDQAKTRSPWFDLIPSYASRYRKIVLGLKDLTIDSSLKKMGASSQLGLARRPVQVHPYAVNDPRPTGSLVEGDLNSRPIPEVPTIKRGCCNLQ